MSSMARTSTMLKMDSTLSSRRRHSAFRASGMRGSQASSDEVTVARISRTRFNWVMVSARSARPFRRDCSVWAMCATHCRSPLAAPIWATWFSSTVSTL